MVEMLVSIEVEDSNLAPIQISIIYNDDGSVNSIDWREAQPELEVQHVNFLDCQWDSDDSNDLDWLPIDTDYSDGSDGSDSESDY
tara:strand:+ start:380 stop:634 length:255 start_codon:yes stop_codon:yes gene_type:complete